MQLKSFYIGIALSMFISQSIIAQNTDNKNTKPQKERQVEEAPRLNEPILAPPKKEPNDSPEIFEFVEQMPEYPSGEDAMYDYIYNHLIVPEEMQVNNISGKTVVGFYIDNKGNLQNLHIQRSLSPEWDKVVMKAFEGMPKWKTGRQNGKEVNVAYSVPVNCTVENELFLSIVEPAPIDPEPTTKVVSGKDEVYDFVEQEAEFPGGEDALMKYLGKNIKYPKSARENNIKGRVMVEFIVQKDGRISDTKIMRGIGFGCDEEVMRVVKSMPTWQPARMNGKAVSSVYKLPVMFEMK